jgi:hypothetical protein
MLTVLVILALVFAALSGFFAWVATQAAAEAALAREDERKARSRE